MPADAISIISAAFVTVVTAIVTYLKTKDALEFKRINFELETAKEHAAESRKDRDDIRSELKATQERHDAELRACHERHDECDRRATKLEYEVSLLQQRVQPKPT